MSVISSCWKYQGWNKKFDEWVPASSIQSKSSNDKASEHCDIEIPTLKIADTAIRNHVLLFDAKSTTSPSTISAASVERMQTGNMQI